MEQSVIRSNRWNEAARYGLIFGLISAAYLYFGHLQRILGVTGVFMDLLGFAVWAAKIVGCIKLMQYVMKKFVLANSEAISSDIFKLGMLIAMFSALVYSVIAVADQVYIFPEFYQSLYAAVIEESAKIVPASQLEELRMLLVDPPKYTFFSTFIYCFLYGTVLSAILSRNIPPRNQYQ